MDKAPAKRRHRDSQSLNTVVSVRVTNEEFQLLQWLEMTTATRASQIMRNALGAVLQRSRS